MLVLYSTFPGNGSKVVLGVSAPGDLALAVHPVPGPESLDAPLLHELVVLDDPAGLAHVVHVPGVITSLPAGSV